MDSNNVFRYNLIITYIKVKGYGDEYMCDDVQEMKSIEWKKYKKKGNILFMWNKHSI